MRKIDHLGIAVGNLEDAVKFYKENLGLELLGYEEVKEQMVKVAMFKCGESRIELLEATSENSPIFKFIEKKGPGLHHTAIKTDDLEKELKKLEEKGVRLIDSKPRIGAGGHKIAFVHPKSTGGVLLELIEE
jgi:methylmalonyl-CoA/ethylmalonyl-CoA epimerase